MSSDYGSRRAGMNHYLDDLNALPSAADETPVDNFNPDDLALFTNTQFFDFDMGQPAGGEFREGREKGVVGGRSVDPTLKGSNLDFLNDFDPFEYSNFAGLPATTTATAAVVAPETAPILEPHNIQSPITILSPSDPISSQSASSPPYTAPRGTKRKSSSADPNPENFEEASRVAAEEDKRRRNTAASARFRVKKKQREQALEKTAKEMTDKVAMLEAKIGQLEMENKWLKNLIVEKNGKLEKEVVIVKEKDATKV
ncbi:hypothetical protein RUND412_001488 [Rhizina undulata]